MNPHFRQALIGAGANLGDRRANLRSAIEQLRANSSITAVEVSAVYETDPVGVLDQPPFLNLALGVETSLEPEALLAVLLALEEKSGRVRTVRWGPRTLDLDLLAFEGESRASSSLQLPHPRLLEREFVTVPLRELLSRARFLRREWDLLRQQLAALPPASPAVRLCPEGLAP